MGKDFKEKYERVCAIKDRAISLVESQLNGNIENVDAKELGEVADIAKDMAELMELCSEAEYYHAITEAMEKNSDEENRMQMDKYLPESRYYNDGMRGGMNPPANGRNNEQNNGRYYMPIPGPDDMYGWEDPVMMRRGMMPHYYTDMNTNMNGTNISSMDRGNNSRPMNSEQYMRDAKEGRSGITRRTYMDMKENGADKADKVKEIKQWANDFTEDVMEMLENASPEEKTTMKQHLTQLVQKIQ